MKTYKAILAIFAALCLLCGIGAVTASAKEMEECYHCNKTGRYNCPECGNTGVVVCDGCHGAMRFECSGEEGKGKCDNGWYVCPSCNGDGRSRPIPADGNAGPCGQCGGSGKLECWHCHGAGIIVCDRCGGAGKTECQIGDCKTSRQIGWKCSYCKGTGFMGVGNFPPEWNDGVHNVPVKGDYIVTNNKTWAGYRYGEEAADKTSDKTSDKTTDDTPIGTTADPIAPDETPADLSLLPENRNTDFEIPVSADPEAPSDVPPVRVEMGKMTKEEQLYFASLPEEDLARILTNVRDIVASVSAGEADAVTQSVLERIAEKNGIEDFREGRLFPISFEGHQDVGFPVKVCVKLKKGVLDGGTDLAVYHITADGAIESLGTAEYGTYDDGSVENLSFYTNGFSSFFTAASRVDASVTVPTADELTTGATDTTDTLGEPLGADQTAGETILKLVGIFVAIIGVAAAVIFVIVVVKKIKKNKV